MLYQIAYQAPGRIRYIRDENNNSKLSFNTMMDKLGEANFREQYPEFEIREILENLNENGLVQDTDKKIAVHRIDEFDANGNQLYYVSIRPMDQAGLQLAMERPIIELMLMREDPEQRAILNEYHLTFEQLRQRVAQHFQDDNMNNNMMNINIIQPQPIGGRRRRRRSTKRVRRRRRSTRK